MLRSRKECSVRRTCLLIAVSSILLGVTAAGKAQDAVPFQNLATDMMPAQMLERNLANLNDSSPHQGRRVATASPSIASTVARRSAAAITATTYRVSPAVTQKVKEQYAAWAKTAAPNAATQVQQGLRSLDIENVWGKATQENGLKPHDVIDSFTGYYLLNWALANNKDADRAQTLAVRNQFRAMFGGVPALQRSTMAQRQEISETLMVNYIMQLAAYNVATRARDAAMKSRLSDAATRRFQHDMGLDPHQITIGQSGFAIRR